MKPAEILKRLDKARELVAILPEDTEILTVQVDGLCSITGSGESSYVHLKTPFQHLAEANMIEAGGWETEDDPEREFIEDSILTGGFRLFSLRSREAAPGDCSTEDGRAAQAAV